MKQYQNGQTCTCIQMYNLCLDTGSAGPRGLDYKRSKSAAEALSGDLPIDTKAKVCMSG